MSKVSLEDYPKSIKELSFDSSANEFMVHTPVQAIDFDSVKDQFVSSMGKRECSAPKSNDALYIDELGNYYFIEFKNGKNIQTSKGRYELMQKNYDSVFILAFLLSEKIETLREKLQYILVYNEEKHDKEQLNERPVQESRERDNIGKSMFKKVNSPFIRFGQDFFKGYLFSEVFTLNREEFQEMFVSKWEQQNN